VIAGDEAEVLAVAQRFGKTKRLRVFARVPLGVDGPELDDFVESRDVDLRGAGHPHRVHCDRDIADGIDTASTGPHRARPFKSPTASAAWRHTGVRRSSNLGPDACLTGMASQIATDLCWVPGEA